MKQVKVKVSICTLIITILALSTLYSPVHAEQISEKVLFSKDEIKDTDILYKRAKSGITDVEELPVETKELIIKEGNIIKEKSPVETLHTTQKLSSLMVNGEIENYYATTIFTEVYEADLFEEDEGMVVIAGSQSGEKNGSLVRSQSTIYWSDRGSGSNQEFKLSSCRGSWTVKDSSVSLSNRVARLGQMLESPVEYYPGVNSFAYFAPTSWDWLLRTSQLNYVGCTTEVTIKKGTSSSKQVLSNNLYGWPQ